MSEGTLDRTRFEAIERYVLRRMPAEEQALFEDEMRVDEGLRAEVELQWENILAIELGGLSRTLRAVGVEQEREQGEGAAGTARTFVKYAAAVALVICGVLWWMTRPSANERLFAEHFVADPGLPVAMSATSDHAFHDAMVSYKLGDHGEARDKWSVQLRARPGSDTLRYFIANAELAMGHAQAAIPLLEEVVNDPGSAFRAKARWYLFLSHVRTGATERARAMRMEDDPAKGDEARTMLEALQ